MVTPALAGRPSTESRHEVNAMMPSRRSRPSCAAATAALGAVLLLASACGGTDPADRSAVRSTGGSPHAAALSSGASCTGTTAHEKHINLFQCVTCHPQGAAYGFDVPYTFAGGTTTAGGTLVLHTDTTPATCTVACHFPKGAPSKTVAWNTPGPLACTECHPTTALPTGHTAVPPNATRADCETCHVTTGHLDGAVALVGHDPEVWMSTAVPGFHAAAANAGIAECQACHGQDLAGGAAQVSCASCHDQNLPPGITSWKVNCTMCHGGTDSQTGAPPVATWGNDGDPIRVGAHARHVAGSAIAPAFDCDVCHTKPADALSTGHIEGGTAEVIFGGIAAGGPTWNRSLATCAVYCHGETLAAGGTNTAPSWTAAPVACGDCHGAPPPPPHPLVADLTGCVTCHPQTMDATGAIIPPTSGGKHLDGILEASGTHAAGWTDATSAEFHAYSANKGLAACQECHGVALDGVGGMVSIGCQQCHGANWKTNCTMCHGGKDNATGAPPEAIWGSTSAVAVGAHTSHVAPNPVSGAYGCVECHAAPTDALSPGHIGGSAVVSFAGPVSGLKGGTWNYPATASPTCSSTYCHGNFTRGIGTNAPNWNGTDQAACGTCHAARPAAYLHLRHQREYASIVNLNGVQWWPLSGGSTWVTCDQCHFEIAESVSSVGVPTLNVVGGAGPALHVDGKPDVVFKAGGTYDTSDPFQGTCSSMACHPGEVKYWPR